MNLFTKRATRRNSGLETVGIITRLPGSLDFEAVRNGSATTVVAGIRCGECDGDWDDVFPRRARRKRSAPTAGR